jgi:hypothetical protein
MVSIPEKEQSHIVAVFNQHSAAESAFNELQKAGFANNQLAMFGQEVGFSSLLAELSRLDIVEDRLPKLEVLFRAGKSVLIAHGTDNEVEEAFSHLLSCGAEQVFFHRPPGEKTRRVA